MDVDDHVELDTAFNIIEYGVPADKSYIVRGLLEPLASANVSPALIEYWYFVNAGYPSNESAKDTNNLVSVPVTGETDDIVGVEPNLYIRTAEESNEATDVQELPATAFNRTEYVKPGVNPSIMRGLFTDISVNAPPLREYWYLVNVDGTPPDESVNATLNDVCELFIAVTTKLEGALPTRLVVIVAAVVSEDVQAVPENAFNRTVTGVPADKSLITNDPSVTTAM